MQRYKKIKLTQGKWALVDVEDFDWLSQWKWSARKGKAGVFYAQRGKYINGKHLSNYRMHREILNIIDPRILVDHVNGNGLDNRRKNLRKVSFKENNLSKKTQGNNLLKLKGVSTNYSATPPTYFSRLKTNGKVIFLGVFKTPKAAHRAYIKAAKKYHGDYARWK